jgi:hypothetical protein
MTNRKYPALSDTMQNRGDHATRLGLTLAQYNSGIPCNPLNGIRVFPGTDYVDYFHGIPLAQVRDGKALDIWLAGFEAGCTQTKQLKG